MSTPGESTNRGASWRMVGLGGLLIAAGVAGVVFAWFPAPPHSTTATGWPARWLAAGVGWFGVVFAVTGVAGLRGGAGRSLVHAGRVSLGLALVCWSAWLVSLLLR